MADEPVVNPIPGWTMERLHGIATHAGLQCSGPKPQKLLGKPYVAWGCSGPIHQDDLASLVIMDIMGENEQNILSVSGQVNATPRTDDFAGACRRIVGYLIAAMDVNDEEHVFSWLDQVLTRQSTGSMEMQGVTFKFYLHTERSLNFDIHAVGF